MRTYKATVYVESFLDGVLKNSWVLNNRTVYCQKEGHFVSYLGGKRQVIKRSDGTFYWRLEAHTLRAYSINEILEGKKI